MEITFFAGIGIEGDTFLQIGLQLDAFPHDECTSRLYQGSIVAETLQIGFLGAVNVQVIGICGCNNRSKGAQPMERTVKLISFYHYIVTFLRQQQVCAVVLGNASQKRVTLHVRLMQQMCRHGGSGGLAMRTCHTESLACASQHTQYLRAFLNLKTMVTEKRKFGVFLGNGRSIDNKRRIFLLKILAYQIHIILIMDLCTFLYQLLRQFAGRTVITAYLLAFRQEVAHQCTHTDAPCTDKVNGFQDISIHVFSYILQPA